MQPNVFFPQQPPAAGYTNVSTSQPLFSNPAPGANPSLVPTYQQPNINPNNTNNPQPSQPLNIQNSQSINSAQHQFPLPSNQYSPYQHLSTASTSGLMLPPSTSYPVFESPVPLSDEDPVWTSEDAAALVEILEQAERAKWKYIANELTKERNKRITLHACQKKFKDMFGVAEASSQLGSSLAYVVSPDGWECLGDDYNPRTIQDPNHLHSDNYDDDDDDDLNRHGSQKEPAVKSPSFILRQGSHRTTLSNSKRLSPLTESPLSNIPQFQSSSKPATPSVPTYSKSLDTSTPVVATSYPLQQQPHQTQPYVMSGYTQYPYPSIPFSNYPPQPYQAPTSFPYNSYNNYGNYNYSSTQGYHYSQIPQSSTLQPYQQRPVSSSFTMSPVNPANLPPPRPPPQSIQSNVSSQLSNLQPAPPVIQLPPPTVSLQQLTGPSVQPQSDEANLNKPNFSPPGGKIESLINP